MASRPTRLKHTKDEVDIFHSAMQIERERHAKRKAMQNIYRPGLLPASSKAQSSSSSDVNVDDFVFEAEMVEDMDEGTSTLEVELPSANSRPVVNNQPRAQRPVLVEPSESIIVDIDMLDDMEMEMEMEEEIQAPVVSRPSRAQLLAQAQANAKIAQEESLVKEQARQLELDSNSNQVLPDELPLASHAEDINRQETDSLSVQNDLNKKEEHTAIDDDLNLFVSEFDIIQFKPKESRKHTFIKTAAQIEEDEWREAEAREQDKQDRVQQMRSDVISFLTSEAQREKQRKEDEANDSDNLPDDSDHSEEEEGELILWQLREVNRLLKQVQEKKKNEEETSYRFFLSQLSEGELQKEMSLERRSTKHNHRSSGSQTAGYGVYYQEDTVEDSKRRKLMEKASQQPKKPTFNDHRKPHVKRYEDTSKLKSGQDISRAFKSFSKSH